MSALKELREGTVHVILSIGDIVIDLVTGRRGILTGRKRHIDMIVDDIFVWEVEWFKLDDEPRSHPLPNLLEEEGLKMSIVTGLIEWHSIDGGTYEP